MKLDRNAFKTYNFKTFIKESNHYKGYTLYQLFEVFNYLQSIAYTFELNKYPKMDKSVHSTQKNE